MSYLCTPLSAPYMYENIHDRIRTHAEQNPDTEAFVFYDLDKQRHSITRRKLYERSKHLAQVLLNMGLKQGDMVGFNVYNSIESIVSIAAVTFIGAVPFFLTTAIKDGSDLIETMNMMKCRLFITDADRSNTRWVFVKKLLCKTGTRCVPSLQWILSFSTPFESDDDILFLPNLMTSEQRDILLPDVSPDATAFYFCTSGSTGKPKVLAHSHFALLNGTRTFDRFIGINNDSIYFLERPLSWYVGSLRTYPASGATRILVDNRMSISGVNIEFLCQLIQREKCTHMYLPRYIVIDIFQRPELRKYFNCVQVAVCTGERILKNESYLLDGFCKTLISSYGCSEASGIAALKSRNPDEFEDGIAGMPQEGTEVKLADDAGKAVPLGQTGEVLVRSSYRFTEYKNMQDMFSQVVDNQNWFHTGDLAHIRADGNLVIEGRKKEHITIGTVKCFPWNVEKYLKGCPNIKVGLAVGVPDKRLSNVMCACCVPLEGVTVTADDIKKYCDDVFHEDAAEKPRYHLVLTELPLSETGKIDRLGLARLAKHHLDL